MLRKLEYMKSRLERKLELSYGPEKTLFWIAFALVLLYVEVIIAAQNCVYGDENVPLLAVLSAILIIPLCWEGVLACSKLRCTEMKSRRELKKRSRWIALCVFLVTLSMCFLWQRAYWPGSFSGDSIDQFGQVINGEYKDWHPVLQTWIFFTIPYKLFHSAAAIVFLQIVYFSAAVAYLFLVLSRNGAKKRILILALAFILANPNTMKILLYPWKDSAMSIFALVLFAQLAEIYIGGEEWLKKVQNTMAFSVFAFLTLCMRHNAVLLIMPVFIILFFTLKRARRNVIVSAVVVLTATLVLKGPIFALARVERPGHRVMESMGMPMTILTNVYINDREALSEDAVRFMDSLPKEEGFDWAAKYAVGSFNSVKWSLDYDKIDEEGVGNILKYTLEAAIKSPTLARQAFTQLTKMVWTVDGSSGWGIGTGIDANEYGIRYRNTVQSTREELSAYGRICTAYATKYAFNFTGTMILLLLLVAVGNVRRNNIHRLFIVLAPMVYNFGTMLLLSGADFRFFHFNFLIAVPLIFTMTARRNDSANGNGITLYCSGEAMRKKLERLRSEKNYAGTYYE